MSSASSSPDLVRRLAAGQDEALLELYETNVDGLYAFVFYRVGRDASLAEDVVQDTFLDSLAHLADYEPARGSVGAWLCTLSRNVVRRHLKHHPRLAELDAVYHRIDETLAELFAALEGAPLSDEVIARQETRDLVNMTVASLPDRYRTALERRYVAGESLAELAGALGLSPAATKSLLARARHAFRETFLTLSRALVLEARP
jgi:RNA polymerase sigma-70 factor (ECF subfamily)